MIFELGFSSWHVIKLYYWSKVKMEEHSSKSVKQSSSSHVLTWTSTLAVSCANALRTGSTEALDAVPRARCTAPTAAAAAARVGLAGAVLASASTRSLSAWLSASVTQPHRRPAHDAAAARTVALLAVRPFYNNGYLIRLCRRWHHHYTNMGSVAWNKWFELNWIISHIEAHYWA
jgi:hypothetical protein